MLKAAAEWDGPFFVRWDPSEPHLPCVVPEPYASLYPPRDIPPWPSFPDPLAGKPYIQTQMRRTWGVNGWTWADWQPVVSRYLATVSLLDAQVGRVLDALDRLGMAENTLVVYTCDHGDTCGGHGMLDKHNIMYDDVVRVPVLARWPGTARGRVCDAFVMHGLDLAATFCDVAGVPIPDSFRGESLVPLISGATQMNGRDVAFGQYMGSQFGLYSQRMVRDHHWKYVWNPTAEDELYDLDADPGEIVNRAADPACQRELHRLRERLIVWMDQVGDPLCNQWTRPMLLEGRTT
jgi:arylsulfatase A-like enzyme